MARVNAIIALEVSRPIASNTTMAFTKQVFPSFSRPLARLAMGIFSSRFLFISASLLQPACHCLIYV